MKLMTDCIIEIKLWIANNFFKLNEHKTAFIMVGSQHDQKFVLNLFLTGNDEVLPSLTVRSIDDQLYSHLAMMLHSNSTTNHMLYVN